MSKTDGSRFLKGAAILGMAAIVIKVMGAFFRIPLANLIGDTGMSYYQTAYPMYNWLLVISTAGMPAAMAKVIAEHDAIGDRQGVQKIFSTMLMVMVGIGIFSSLVMGFSAKWISIYVKNEGGYLSFIALAPAVLFVSVMSSFRGYFQGLQNMKPYAFSQIIEQIFRVGLGLGLAFLLYDKGLEWASAGATFGATAGAFFGCILIAGFYIYYQRKRVSGKEKNHNGKKIYIEKVDTNNIGEKNLDIVNEVNANISSIDEERYNGENLEFEEIDGELEKGLYNEFSRKSIIKKVLMIAIPITMGASIIPIMTMLDLFIVMRRLYSIGIVENANALYGQLTGYAQTLVNLPQTVCAAIQISVVPAVAGAMLIKNKKTLNDTIHTGIRLALIIGLPCAFGFMLLAEPIMRLLYPMQLDISQNTGAILSILGLGVVFLPLYQVTTGVLQGIGKPHKPAIHLFIGAILKGILNYVLVGVPILNIKGAAMATVSAFAFAAILNFVELIRTPSVVLDMKKIFVKPLISAGIMAILIKPIYGFIHWGYLEFFSNKEEFMTWVASSNSVESDKFLSVLLNAGRWSTVGTVAICGIVYLLALLFTGTITDDELNMLPVGRKISRFVNKFRK